MEAGAVCCHSPSLMFRDCSSLPAALLSPKSPCIHPWNAEGSFLCRSVRHRNLFLATAVSTLAAGSQKKSRENRLSVRRDEDLKYWLQSNGLPSCKVVLKRRYSKNKMHKATRYVAASERLQPGDVAFTVPNSLVVTLERVIGDENLAELLTTNKLSEIACLTLYLLYEKQQGKRSFWYPYIRELDRQCGSGQLDVQSPLLWSEDELAYLNGSPTKDEVLRRAEGIQREYGELDTIWFMAGSLFQQYPYDIPTETFPFTIFKQAFVAVQSCVVHLQNVSLARRFALVPLGPPCLAYKSDCNAMLTAGDDAVQLIVDRPYKAGDCIVVWCGPQPNSKLILNYGFVDEDNTYDRLVIEASLSTDDPLYHNKRVAVQRNGKLSRQTFHVPVGKEKQTILNMLPYLRLAYVSDPSKMELAISSRDSTFIMDSPSTEGAILEQLNQYFRRRISSYPTTLDEDEHMLEDCTLNPKQRIATQLVRLEKKMLIACLKETDDLIKQLPGDSVQPFFTPYAPTLK